MWPRLLGNLGINVAGSHLWQRRWLFDQITDFAQDVRACALGQAAASVLGANVIGRTRPEIEQAREALAAMLTEGGPAPAAPFDALEVLIPARSFQNRHKSILLALEATAEAMAQAERAACA